MFRLQRPTAFELLSNKFIKSYSKKASHLVDLIIRYREWKAAGGDGSDSDSDIANRLASAIPS